MLARIPALALAIPILEFAVCHSPSNPHVEVVPQIEFQAGDLVLGTVVYVPCRPPEGAWKMDRLPPEDPVVLDLYYVRQSVARRPVSPLVG